jgi:NAD(P)-dependent dehydrogenase (short-subunit alcohol dehydrogenase family)
MEYSRSEIVFLAWTLSWTAVGAVMTFHQTIFCARNPSYGEVRKQDCSDHWRQQRHRACDSEGVCRRGCVVYITGRRRQELDKAAAQIGRNVTAAQCDVSVSAELDQLYTRVKLEKGRVDIVFANAGTGNGRAPLGQIHDEQFDRIFNTNVKGLLFSVQKALPLMQTGGVVILNSSIGAQLGMATSSLYAASKAAVRSFARSWTAELRNTGIRVNVISPGYTETPIFETLGLPQEQLDAIKADGIARIPLGRFADPKETARVVVFLASEDSSYLAGADVQVDGGLRQV